MKSIMKKIILLSIFAICLSANACKTAQSNASSPELKEAEALAKKKKKKKTRVRGTSLTGELRRVPGLRVSGDDQSGRVVLRGNAASIAAGNNPLFVLDGIQVGTSLPQVSSMIDVTKIDKIQLLKESEAGMYGARGSNGVIEITMMKE